MSAPPPPAGLPRPSRRTALLALTLLCFLWGSTWVVIQFGLRDLPPYTSAAVRFAVAGAVMVGITPLLRAREGGAAPPRWLWVVLGSLNFALSYGIVYRTETYLPSGLTAVLWGVYPMMMASIGHVWLPGERLRGVQAWGFLLGFVGLTLLYAVDVSELGPGSLGAALLLLASPLVSAVGTALVKRHGAGTSSLALNRNGMLLGALLLTLAARALEADAEVHWTPRAILSVLYLAVCGTVVTFGLYFWLLRTIDANRMGLI
ncbi:MAG TPA: EamA family transporter, partial [Planctomycetota bacterium]|nr:EamA family transporter [Planctomycetota bacterium]